MKLFLCPYSQSKCFATTLRQDYDEAKSTRILMVGDANDQVGGTTLDFNTNDICGWHLIADTQFPREKYIRVKIEVINNSKCFINSGSGIDTATHEISCASDSTYDFDADQHVFIVVLGSSSGSYVKFKYSLVDRLTYDQVSIIYAFSVFFFILLSAAVVVLVIRFVVQYVIRNNQVEWQKTAIEMKQMINLAEKRKTHINEGVQPYSQDQTRSNNGYNQGYPESSHGPYNGSGPYNRKMEEPKFNLY